MNTHMNKVTQSDVYLHPYCVLNPVVAVHQITRVWVACS